MPDANLRASFCGCKLPRLGIVLALAVALFQCRLSSQALPRLLAAAPARPDGQAMVLLAGVGTSGTRTPGGQRNVGRLFAEQLQSMGADIAVVARTKEAAEELEAMGCRVAGVGDLTDADFAKEVMNAVKPVTLFSAVGGKDSEGNRADGVANINLFKAASELRVKPHVVFVTSWGCGESWQYLDERTKEILGPALRAKTEAEDFLRESDLNHMIVRPGGLLSESEATKRGILVRRPDVGGTIRRQDVAEMLVWLPRRADTNRLAVTAVDQDMMRAEPPLQPDDILPFAGPGE
eukprot:TRINITY_DN53476_c0_g1_i1.p1 TRINITY_DN53476_c0_g1~~TRINITY_DN53476_c0_g1_i1.p1  ORF type:complete len:293 (-),score=55.11 TRINITY_DN53476_c0_g1_i1:11-889(-)